MFRSSIKAVLRNFWKNKSYSFLNILGLAIGIACAGLIFLWVEDETNFDRVHVKKDRLYMVLNNWPFSQHFGTYESTPGLMGPSIKAEIPGVANICRTTEDKSTQLIAIGNKSVYSDGAYADSSLFSMFTIPFVQGNASTAFIQTHSMVITEKAARKYFGREHSVLGRTVRLNNKQDYRITGVVKDFPENNSIQFEWLVPFDIFYKENSWLSNWDSNGILTMVELEKTAHADAVNQQLHDLIKKRVPKTIVSSFLFPMKDWHLRFDFENGKPTGRGRIQYVHMFSLIAWIILFLACINFMNLSTARSEKRAKEVGIRKVAGAYKSALILQFLGESLLIAFISGVLALLLVQFSLPSFDLLVGKELILPFSNFYFWLFALLFILITGILAGSYPAFFLSSFQPVSVLKGTFRKVQAVITPRRVLVILQFSFAIILIISTLVVVTQIRYAQNRNSGYDRSQLVYHFLTGDLNRNYLLLKNDLLRSGVASSVCRTFCPLTEVWSDTWSLEWQGKSPYDKTDFDHFSEDEGLVKTAGLKITQGRDMNLEEYPTDSSAELLNESAVKAMGFKNPIGQLIKNGNQTFHVVGVIRDFIQHSPYEPLHPMFIEGSQTHNTFNVVNIKLDTRKSTADNMAKMEMLFRKYNPDYPFEYHFVDEQYARKFDDTKRTATLSALFAGLTILISCLGLFGLASFVAAQRTKEIGVRKVLGASVINLWKMLSRDFVALIVISLCIATPVAYYFMYEWLQNFEYRTGLSWWIFASAGAGALVITLLTVSYQSIKAAMGNPVDSLRTE